jgi:transcriptional regulator with XRE-family HTH domain
MSNSDQVSGLAIVWPCETRKVPASLDVASRIREARIAKGWTHDELAAAMGVNWRTVQRWQKGQLPRLGTLMKLADVLDVPRSFFLDDTRPDDLLREIVQQLEQLTRDIQTLRNELAAVLPPQQKSVPGPQRRAGR